MQCTPSNPLQLISIRMSAVWRAYTKLLEIHPWKVQSLSTGVLLCVGDLAAQFLVERRNLREFDALRTCRLGAIGVLFMGPSLRAWYLTLDKLVGTSGKTVAIKKVILDQGFFAPLMLMGFFGALGGLQGQTTKQIKSKIKQDYLDVLITGCAIWPAAQLINFYFTPPQHRILFVNTIAIFWNTYLAYKTNATIKS